MATVKGSKRGSGKEKGGSTKEKGSKRAAPGPPPGAQMGAKGESDYFQPGFRLRDRWLLEKRIGDGAFGQVFLAKDTKEGINVAIKTEKMEVPRKCLCMEVGVMRTLGKSLNVPFLMACGRTPDCRFIIMELLGGSLFDLRSTYPKRILPVPVTCRVGVQSLRALQDVHEAGFVHRDVKPANFALGKHPKVAGNVFIFDFGLSRIHLINGKPRKSRKFKPGFRGTLRYASLASHNGDDLGRVDDLIPVHFMLVEMAIGQVPWKAITDRHEVKDSKSQTSQDDLCKGLPKQFSRMGKALERATYKSQPRYDKLSSLLVDVLQKMNEDPKLPILPGGK